MGLVVETGAGLANADSYLSVASANAYYTANSSLVGWDAADEPASERALRLATRFIDVRYGRRWLGVRASQTQALDWPRVDAQDADGYTLASTTVPLAVQNATAEAAFRFAAGEDLLTDQQNAAAVKSTSVKVGPIEKSIEYAEPNQPAASYPIIDGLLNRLTRVAGELRRS